MDIERLYALGTILILIGAGVIMLSSFFSAKNSAEFGFAGGGFIGPIPFGFFSSEKMFWIWSAIVLFSLILWVIFRSLA